MIAEANEQGYDVLSMTEFWIGPVNEQRRDARHYESCPTCKQLLPAMLCDAKPEPGNKVEEITIEHLPNPSKKKK